MSAGAQESGTGRRDRPVRRTGAGAAPRPKPPGGPRSRAFPEVHRAASRRRRPQRRRRGPVARPPARLRSPRPNGGGRPPAGPRPHPDRLLALLPTSPEESADQVTAARDPRPHPRTRLRGAASSEGSRLRPRDLCPATARPLRPEVRTALRLGLYALRHHRRTPARAVVHDAVELAYGRHRSRGAAGLVNAILRSYLRADHPWPHPGGDFELYLRVGLSWPDWLVDRAVAALGRAGARARLEAGNRIPTTFLRVSRQSDPEEVRRQARR